MVLLDTPICDFGKQAPAFKLSAPDGTVYSMGDIMGEKGMLIAFICNHCPYVQAIIMRLVEDARSLMAEGIGVAAIMSNDYHSYESDSPENMQIFIAEHGMFFPYLVDETQEVAQAYGAVCTPDFFGFNNQGKLQYRGRLDDAKMSDSSSRTEELLLAMRQVADTGQGPKEQVPSMGCSIKWRY